MPRMSFFWLLNLLVVLILIGLGYSVAVWDFSSPFAVSKAVHAGRLREGMSKKDVLAELGSHWRVEERVPGYPMVEQWCRWWECVYFDKANGNRLIDWRNFWLSEAKFPPVKY